MVERSHLVRQSVLDTRGALVAYSLQVRQGRSGASAASGTGGTRTLLNVVNSPSFGRLMGDCEVFVDLPGAFLFQEIDGFLPRSRSVIMLPQPSAEPGLEEAVRQRHEEKVRVGFEVTASEGAEELSRLGEVGDYLRFDLGRYPNPSDLTGVVAPFRTGRAQWLATGVHSQEAFQRCQALGFSLFQGQFFTEPAVLSSDALNPRQSTLLELFGQLSRDAEFAEIETTFKHNPDLSHQLLELLNSAAFRRRDPIYSLRQALVLLGKDNLRKWIALLLFAEDGEEAMHNPLFGEAVLRARTMELAAARIQNSDAFTGSAFLTGVFSVIQALLMRPLNQVIADLNLDRPIAGALLERRGVLGQLLDTVERLREQKELAPEMTIGERTFRDRDWFEYEEQAAFEFSVGA
jgi:EAL and modified HD-GYP domain-containing signal transduction protein